MRILATALANPRPKTASSTLDLQLGLPLGSVERGGGVKFRYLADKHTLQSELAAEALSNAAARASIRLDSLDLILSASALPEQALPNTASAILRQLDLPGASAFDINSSCLSFLTAMRVAGNFLQTRTYHRIGIVACDLASRGLDWSTPEASYIFGDGAAAVILEAGGGGAIEAFSQRTYPEGFGHCQIKAGGSRLSDSATLSDMKFSMDGRGVFKLAAKVLPEVVEDTLTKAELGLTDIQVFVPHQASHLGLQHMVKRLGLPQGKTIDIYADNGNQVGASLPTALNDAFERGLLVKDSRAMLLGTAAGLTAGCMVVRV